MIVSNFMTRNPIYATKKMFVNDVNGIMTREKIRRLPVLDDEKRIVGIVTVNDLRRVTPSQVTSLDMYEMSYLLSKLRVEKVMHSPVITTNEDCVLEEAARILADNKISSLPVVKGDSLIGIITETDILRAFIDMFGSRHKGIRATFQLTEKKGQLATLCTKIYEMGANIISLVTSEGDDVEHRRCTFKVDKITLENFKELLERNEVELEDFREI